MTNKLQEIVFYSGSSNPKLADAVAHRLNTHISDSIHDAFSNGECRVELHENVRRRHVYIFQTGSSTETGSINDHLMELLLMVNAARLSDAESITVICPNFPYARQDKKDRSRTPISSRVVAEMLQTAGVTRLVTMDLHSNQIQGFFTIPVDNLFAQDLIINYLQKELFDGLTTEQINQRYVLVSPDAGGAKRVLKMAEKMQLNSVLMHKQRDHSKKNHVDKTIIVGDEGCLVNKTCIIVDDMTDTLGTVVKACDELVAGGAKDVIVCITHGVLSGPAIDRLNACDAITQLVTSNTIAQDHNTSRSDKVRVFDVSGLFATCIERIVNGGSISELFNSDSTYTSRSDPANPEDWPKLNYLGVDMRSDMCKFYAAITELNLWDWLAQNRDHNVYSRHPNITALVHHPLTTRHSGGSFNVALNICGEIAQVGFDKFCQSYETDF